MNNMPKILGEVSPECLTNLLRKHKAIDKSMVVSYQIDPQEQAGYFSKIRRLRITYDNNEPQAPKTLIAKVLTEDQNSVKLGHDCCIYRSEYHFYDEIAPLNTIRVPKCYYNHFSPDGILLIMEDLASLRLGDPVNGISLEDAKCFVGDLAKFHAYWWDNRKLNSFDWLMLIEDPRSWDPATAHYSMLLPHFLKKWDADLTEREKNIARQYVPQVSLMVKKLSKQPLTIIHGDLRATNVFYNDAEQNTALLDWQILRKGRGSVDLGFFLSQNMDTDLRRGPNEKLILEGYYQTLLANGVKNYQWKECWDDYRMGVYYFWINAMVVSTTVNEGEFANTAKMMMRRTICALQDLEIEELYSK